MNSILYFSFAKVTKNLPGMFEPKMIFFETLAQHMSFQQSYSTVSYEIIQATSIKTHTLHVTRGGGGGGWLCGFMCVFLRVLAREKNRETP